MVCYVNVRVWEGWRAMQNAEKGRVQLFSAGVP